MLKSQNRSFVTKRQSVAVIAHRLQARRPRCTTFCTGQGKEIISLPTADAILQPMDDTEIADLTKSLIEADPEMLDQLKKYQEAMARVDRAKIAAEELEKQMSEAAATATRSDKEEEKMRREKAAQLMADAEVAAAEKLLMAAELQNAMAQQEKERLSAEISQNAGRVESGKAAACALVGGLAGVIPFALIQDNVAALPSFLSLLAAAASCALFGVTYRYAVGSNPQNPHLKGGVVTAFGIVRSAAAADMLQLASPDGPFTYEVIGSSALYAGQSVLMFAFAATAVEVAFQQGLLRRIDEVVIPPV